jgi:type IV pilus assembly protein PilY1
MKTALQALVCSVALAGLAYTAAAHATNLAELPLKPSVLAKPNVILGMDDSGSMDSEVLLDTSDGVFWWNFDSGRGWDNAGVLYRHVNLGEYWSSTWRRYFYLFPNGNGTGLNIKPEATYGDWSLMPTSEFAWSRSSAYNPQYYNPAVTYKPWATAHTYAAFTDASPSAARGHPIYGGSGNVVDLTATRAASETTSRYFTAVKGMTIPAGATASECDATIGSCGSWTAVAADAAAAANRVTRVAMAYWPATYWIKATSAFDCTVPAVTSVGTDDCALAPDGQKLRRIEIRSTNTSYPSGRTYAQELQNFANWFQYHRKRRLSANAALGETLDGLTGLRLGAIRFNARPADSTRVTMWDLDSTTAASNGKAALKFVYEIDSNVGTPTRATLRRIGHEFAQSAGPIQYACQRNAALIVTDGYASATSVSPPTYDSAVWGAAAPYATTHAGTLADIALSYYTNTMGGGSFAAGKVPTSAADANSNLHMNTYALTLGAKGDLFTGEGTAVPTSTAAWVNPNTDFNPSAVDDLWHATINGRGQMYLAAAASDTAEKLRSAFLDILDQVGAQSSIGVSSVNLGRGDDFAYLGSYNTRGWTGELTRNAANPTTGTISTTATWSAAALLAARDWTTRLIFTSNDVSGLDFTSANVGATVNPDTATFSNDQVVNWMRGSRAGEGSSVRRRTSLIGAVINAEPVISRSDGVAYLASGEGLLHAFDTATGAELWAYHPAETLAASGAAVERGWVFKTLLDATPTFAQLSTSSKLLVGGLGAAGRSYYALDVSSPRPATAAAAAAQFKWVFPASTDAANRALMGYTIGKPIVTKAKVSGTVTNVVLVTSGYDNGLSIGDGKGRLWMLNAATGAVIKTFRTTEGSAGDEAGLAHVSAFKEYDGTTRYVFGGDLKGNLWRFDLEAAGSSIDATLLTTFFDAAGNRQPVTAAPDLVWQGSKRVVLVGTGRLLDIGDFGSTRTQSFYAVADGTAIANARNGLVTRTYSRVADDGTVASTPLTGSAIDWATQRGWYVDLPSGEQANTQPVVTYGTVAFVTNKQGSADCSQSSYLYLINIADGLKVAGSDFVAALISDSATSSRVITLRTVGGQIYGTTHRSDNTVFQRQLPLGTTIPPSKNAWRELRR